MLNKKILVLIGLFLIPCVFAVSDSAVFQGQYFLNNQFQEGTFEFVFNVYDAEIGGNLVYSQTKTITTGFWGQWRTELSGLSSACNDVAKDYFMEIVIDGNVQSPMRKLTHFNYLRKNVNETTSNSISVDNKLYVYDLYVNSTKVCLSDGTNCQVQNFSELDTFQTVTNRGSVTNKNITIGSFLGFILGWKRKNICKRCLYL